MSHSTVLVILPKDTPLTTEALHDAVETALAPFDENMAVPPYEKPCSCVGLEAQVAAREQAAAAAVAVTGKTMEDYRAAFSTDDRIARMQAGERVDLDAAWAAHIADYAAAYDARYAEVLAADPRRDAPDPACASCGGTGVRTTTYNPQSKWDWYSIGGRWNGDFLCGNAEDEGARERTGKAAIEAIIARSEDEAQVFVATWGGNGGRCRDCQHGPQFAVLTPDGEWHQKGQMGWWGMVTDEQPAKSWEAEYYELLSGHPDHPCVLVDVHI